MYSLRSVILTQFGADFYEEQISPTKWVLWLGHKGVQRLQGIDRHVNRYRLNVVRIERELRKKKQQEKNKRHCHLLLVQTYKQNLSAFLYIRRQRKRVAFWKKTCRASTAEQTEIQPETKGETDSEEEKVAWQCVGGSLLSSFGEAFVDNKTNACPPLLLLLLSVCWHRHVFK